jgi:hypothetical protein
MDFGEAARLVRQQIAIEESALADGLLKEGWDLAEMEDGDLAPAGAFTFPTVRRFGWKNPEMMLVEHGLIRVGEDGPACAPQDGEELPVVTLVDVRRVQAEAADSQGQIAQHQGYDGADGRICKALDLDIVMKSG